MTIQTPEQVRALIAERDKLLAALNRIIHIEDEAWESEELLWAAIGVAKEAVEGVEE